MANRHSPAYKMLHKPGTLGIRTSFKQIHIFGKRERRGLNPGPPRKWGPGVVLPLIFKVTNLSYLIIPQKVGF